MRRKLWAAGAAFLVAGLTVGVLAVGGTPEKAAGAAVVDPAACQGYPEPRVFLESQGWWRRAGDPPEGRHIHVGACFPLDQIVSGLVHLDVVVKLHNNPGRVTGLRWQVFDGLTVAKAVSLACATDCTFTVPIDANVNGLAAGRWENRLTANIKDANGYFGKRLYQTTRWHFYVKATGPRTYSPGRNPGAAGWEAGTYVNVFCGPTSGSALVYADDGSGRTVTCKFEGAAFASVDPNVHAGDFGRVILQKPAAGTYSFLVPDDLAPGQHKLMVKAEKKTANATTSGVLVLPFTVVSDEPAAEPLDDGVTFEPPPETTAP